MLGDKLLFGQTTNKVDSKRRMFLPSESGRENGDIAYIVYDSVIDEYTVVPKTIVEEEYRKLEGMIEVAWDAKSLNEYKSKLIEFANSIIKECVVDKQGRILLSDNFIPNEEINIMGIGKCFILSQEKSIKKKK